LTMQVAERDLYTNHQTLVLRSRPDGRCRHDQPGKLIATYVCLCHNAPQRTMSVPNGVGDGGAALARAEADDDRLPRLDGVRRGKEGHRGGGVEGAAPAPLLDLRS